VLFLFTRGLIWNSDNMNIHRIRETQRCDKLPQIFWGISFIVLIWGIGYMVSHHQNAIEKRYGFCTMTPDLKWTPCHIEPMMIRCVKQGGAFEKAGFSDRDILVLPLIYSVNAFYKLLVQPKGTIIELNSIPYEQFKPDCDPDKRGKSEKRYVIAP
jgi:hypothetical protein